MLALYKHGGHITKQWLMFTGSGAVALGLAYVGDKVASPHYPLGLYMTISYFMPTIYVLIIYSVLRRDRIINLKKEIVQASWKLPSLSVVSVAGYYLLLKALAISQASIAVPIIFSSTILTAVGGIFILKEKSNIFEKLIGTVFVFLGIVLLH